MYDTIISQTIHQYTPDLEQGRTSDGSMTV